VVETIYFSSKKYLCALNTAGQLKWKYPISTQNYGRSPAIGKDGVIYLKGSKEFYAIRPDGHLLWKYPEFPGLFMDMGSTAIDANGTIIFTSTEKRGSKLRGAVIALNPDGSLKWRYPTPEQVASSPTITADGTILILCRDGILYALGGK